ncbi:MAG: MFS transporter [Saprospiraceae bacterium]
MIIRLVDFIKHPASRAIGIVFALCGFGFGTWASFIPFVKEKFILDEAQLGLLLLCLPLGNFIANPLSVILIRKWGPVKVSLIAGSMTAFFFAVPVTTPWLVLGAFGLFLAGGFFAFTNVGMNTCASLLETASGHRIMSTCHGMWSIGAMCGALFSGLALMPLKIYLKGWLTPQILYAFGLATIILIITWVIRHELNLIPREHDQPVDQQKIKWKSFRPGKYLWILITICLCTYLTEGTMADWSAVYLREITKATEIVAGWGFAVYSFFMAGGRFLGDDLIARYGPMKVLRNGGILVFAGLMIVVFSNGPWITLPGFMLIGAGISFASPILYSAAAKIAGLGPGIGLATLNTFAMASFFGGPVLIGFIGKIFDLRIAFTLVAVASIIWIIQTTRVIRQSEK